MALFADGRNAAPDLRSPPPELLEGIRAVKESMDAGEITQEEGNDLIAYLYSAWIGAAAPRMIADYLDRSVALSLGQASPNETAQSESESIKAYEKRASRRRRDFAYFCIGLATAVGMAVSLTLTDNADMIIPIITAAGGIFGGFAVGRHFRG